jgi:hypothetical protein
LTKDRFPARRGILEDPANACDDVFDVFALRFHNGTAARGTSSRIKWLRERQITASILSLGRLCASLRTNYRGMDGSWE